MFSAKKLFKWNRHVTVPLLHHSTLHLKITSKYIMVKNKKDNAKRYSINIETGRAKFT